MEENINPEQNIQEEQQPVETEVLKKKKSPPISIVIGVIILLLIAGGVFAYFQFNNNKSSELSDNLSFLEDVIEFHDFRLGMSTSEIIEIVDRNALTLEGSAIDGFFIINNDGETLALSMDDGVCVGIQRLQKQIPWKDTNNFLEIKSLKNSYQEGDIVRFTIENRTRVPVWHDNTCSIGPCFNGNECIRLIGIDCTQDKLESGKKIELEYARPVRIDETKFIFYYNVNLDSPPDGYREAMSNEILVSGRDGPPLR